VPRVSDPERARRLARVLFSDIVAYAGDQVRIGLEKDDLFERLRLEIERARAWYFEQVDPELPGAERIFNFALVDVLIYSQRNRVSTHIW
jgi:hypothetical protein